MTATSPAVQDTREEWMKMIVMLMFKMMMIMMPESRFASHLIRSSMVALVQVAPKQISVQPGWRDRFCNLKKPAGEIDFQYLSPF